MSMKRLERQKHTGKSKTLNSKRWKNKRTTRRKSKGNHLPPSPASSAPPPPSQLCARVVSRRVASAFPSSVGYVARKSKRRFDKRMDRYTHERATAEKVKVNKRRKSEKHERRKWSKKTEHAYVCTYTRAAAVCRRRRRETKKKEGKGDGSGRREGQE